MVKTNPIQKSIFLSQDDPTVFVGRSLRFPFGATCFVQCLIEGIFVGNDFEFRVLEAPKCRSSVNSLVTEVACHLPS